MLYTSNNNSTLIVNKVIRSNEFEIPEWIKNVDFSDIKQYLETYPYPEDSYKLVRLLYSVIDKLKGELGAQYRRVGFLKELVDELLNSCDEKDREIARLKNENAELKDLMEIVGINGGGAKLTMMRCIKIAEYAMTENPNKNTFAGRDGEVYLNVEDIEHFLKKIVDGVLRISDKIKYPKQVAYNCCKWLRNEKNQQKIGITVKDPTKGVANLNRKIGRVVFEIKRKLEKEIKQISAPKKEKTAGELNKENVHANFRDNTSYASKDPRRNPDGSWKSWVLEDREKKKAERLKKATG